ncbi:hypothetical protein FS749_006906 [Ceratobasidium sp. UAMH 11750]|nr:hypothetical protein FS749_006906 [Ceratobasidium sp. UAMH 11750]
MDMKSDPGPDYGALLDNIRPTPTPMVDHERISDAARIVEAAVETVALELRVTGCLVFQALLFSLLEFLFTSLEFLFTSLELLFRLWQLLAPCLQGVFKIVGRTLGVVLSALVRFTRGTYGFSGVILDVIRVAIFGYGSDVMYTNRRLPFKSKESAKVQGWEPSQDGHSLQEPKKDICSNWFAKHPVSFEPLPTPTSRRHWKFSYSKKKPIVEPLTPPITPVRNIKKKGGRK